MFDHAADLIDDRSLTGSGLCAALTARTDGFLASVFAEAGGSDGAALAAVGGYGRRELCPGSDIDVVLVHHPDLAVHDLAERLWYPLWDAGLKLGHQVGTVDQILDVARANLDVATSLLATRAVAGGTDLIADLADRGRAQWVDRSRHHLAELGRAVTERHAQFGEVAFLLEPDLKEARGGLRDAHTLMWVEATVPVLRPDEAAALAEAVETLLAVRVELHRVTRSRSDRLLLELQDDVADRLGHDDADRLMADVAAAARTIAWTGDGVTRHIQRAAAGRGRRGLRRTRRREIGPGLVLDDGRLEVTGEALSDPFVVLRSAVAAAGHGAYMDRDSLDALAGSEARIPEPWPDEARRLFEELLSAGAAAIPVIEGLDHRGLFVPLLPEWEPCRSRPQRNAYHRFTVDRHLLEAAAGAALLVDRVERPDLLVVGTLLHDIGKGYPGDHTEVGVELVARIAERMGYPPDDVALLVAMVEHHLLLPDVATRRDLDDDGTIRSVAAAVGSTTVLGLLDALTEADSVATGPSAWSTWKAELVAELVARVRHVLGGGDVLDVTGGSFPTPEQQALLDSGERIIRGEGSMLTVVADDRPGVFSKVAGVLALNGADVLDAAAHSADGRALSVFRVQGAFGRLPDWARVQEQIDRALSGRLAVAARLGDRSRTYRATPTSARPARPKVSVDNTTSAVATVLEVSCPDGVGVLYRITRAFAELDLDIVSARVQTIGSDVIDAFYVRDGDGARIVDPDHLAEIELSVLRWVRADF